MRALLFGNAGSGKTFYAEHLARRHGLAHLDLDSIFWEPGQVGVLRPMPRVAEDLTSFLDAHSRWVIEGCTSALVALAAADCTELVFMNPGEAVCLANCRARPWEPQKYASKPAQDDKLALLLEWVHGYYVRDDEWSLARHRQLFRGHDGAKREVSGQLNLHEVGGHAR